MFEIDIDMRHIEKTLKKIDHMSEAYDDAIADSLNELADIASAKMSQLATAYGINESALHKDTMYTDVSELRVEVGYDSEYADYVEFGTGIRGENSPHPEADNEGWEYNVKGHIRAWSFSADEMNEGNIGYVTPSSSGKRMWTKGMPSRPVVYMTQKYMKLRITKVMRKHLRKVEE